MLSIPLKGVWLRVITGKTESLSLADFLTNPKIRFTFFTGLITFALFTVLTLNRNSHFKLGDYHSQLWSDKAGYYIYLPATFIYQWDASKMDSAVIPLTGQGFENREGKFYTKYSYGTALLNLPGFLIAHIFSVNNTGFDTNYINAINISAVFYLTIAILLLALMILEMGFSASTTAFSISAILLGTNLYFYVTREAGMSHVYSFFAFSNFIYFRNKSSLDSGRIKWTGLIISTWLIYIIRPLNIVFCLILLIKPFISSHNKIRIILSFALCGIFFTLPQWAYNLYIYNSIWAESYPGEKFSYLLSPKIAEILISPHNGALLYNPMYALLFLSVFQNWKKHIPQIAVIISYLYLYGSWFSYFLGCSYGHRGLVDILPLMIIPFCEYWKQSKNVYWGIILVVFCVWNIVLTLNWDGCYYGKGDWDWGEYIRVIIESFGGNAPLIR